MINLQRSFRRKSGISSKSYDNDDRIAGPWHIVPTGRDGATQCGKRLKMVSVQRQQVESLDAGVAPQGKICRTCVIWHEQDRQKPVR